MIVHDGTNVIHVITVFSILEVKLTKLCIAVNCNLKKEESLIKQNLFTY